MSTKMVLEYDDAQATAAFDRLSKKMGETSTEAGEMAASAKRMAAGLEEDRLALIALGRAVDNYDGSLVKAQMQQQSMSKAVAYNTAQYEQAIAAQKRMDQSAKGMASSLGIGNSALTAVASASGPAGAALGQVAQSLGKVGTGMLATGAIGYELSHIVGHLTGNVDLQSKAFNEWGKQIANVIIQYTALAKVMEADKASAEQQLNQNKQAAKQLEEVLRIQQEYANARKSFNDSEKNSGLVNYYKDLFRSQTDIAALDEKMLDARQRRADLEKEFATAGSNEEQVAIIEKEKALQVEIVSIEQRRQEIKAKTAADELAAQQKRKQQEDEFARSVDERHKEEKRQQEELAKLKDEEHKKELERIEAEKKKREDAKNQRIKDIFALSKATQSAAQGGGGVGGPGSSAAGGDGAAVVGDPFAGMGPFARAAMGGGFNRNGIATGGAVVSQGIGNFPGLMGADGGIRNFGGGGPMAGGPGGGGSPAAGSSLEEQMKALFQSRLGKIDDQDVEKRAWENFRKNAGNLTKDEETSNRRRIFKGGGTSSEIDGARRQLEDEAQKEIEARLESLNKQGAVNDKQLEATKRAIEEYKNTQQQLEATQADLDDVMQTLNIVSAGANNREARRRAQRGARGN